MPSYCIVQSGNNAEYVKEWKAWKACNYEGPSNDHPLNDYSKWVLESLAKNVNTLLKEGWVCTGGIQVISNGGHYNAAIQAMVKND